MAQILLRPDLAVNVQRKPRPNGRRAIYVRQYVAPAPVPAACQNGAGTGDIEP
jgi:hypothetical protein